MIYLNNEFDRFWNKIVNNENFAFLRYGDGEKAIMCGESVTAQEGWVSPNFVSKLGSDLLDTLNIDDGNFYYGISCPCCDSKAYYWYSTRIKSKNISFANLWVNGNYEKFFNLFKSLKRDAVLIANHNAQSHSIGNLNILKHYKIDDNCINFWENNAEELIKSVINDFGNKNDLLYVVSAGPMSEPIITKLYKNNPNNCYIDFGSAIDEFLYNKKTRPYMNNRTKYAKKNCFMYNPLNMDFTVSVVLNLYKRPENLELQINSIKKQSLKPKEILLYQDGTSDYIKIPEHVKNDFDIIEISEKNKGVWARFDFAKRVAKSKYVCVFDDDTIPGCRWLENCHSEMMKQEALYGTIGIIMKKPEFYPKKRHTAWFRVGWLGCLNKTTEVDFVGHSWFFKKDWLEYLFEAPSSVQKFKVAGEDMSFSFQLLKNGIKTFVPPHPYNKPDLFGSLPEWGMKLGKDKNALSMNNNGNNMQVAKEILLLNYWSTLIKRNPKYVRKVQMELFWTKVKNFFQISAKKILRKFK